MRNRGTPRVLATAYLRRFLSETQLNVGDFLPSERELAHRAEVSRVTMHTALVVMAGEGWVVPAGEDQRGWRLARAVAGATQTRIAAVGLTTALTVIATWTKAHPHGTGALLMTGMLKEAEQAGMMLVSLPASRIAEAIGPVVVLHPAERDPGVADAVRAFVAAGRVVCVQDEDGAAQLGTAQVRSDHRQGGALVGAYLQARGLATWAAVYDPHVATPAPPWLVERWSGTIAVLGEPVERLQVIQPFRGGEPEVCDARIRIMESHLRDLFQRHPGVQALCCVTDRAAMVAQAAIERIGGPRPLVTGYDANWLSMPESRHGCPPPAVTVDKCDQAIGAALVQCVRGSGSQAVAPELVVPGSAG